MLEKVTAQEKVRAWHGGLVAKVFPLNRPGSHMGASSIPAAPLPIQLPVCGLGKQLKMAQSLGILHHVGDLEEAPGSWLWISSAPAMAATWEVNQ